MKGGTQMRLKFGGRLTDFGHETFEKLTDVKVEYDVSNNSYSVTISHNNYKLVIKYKNDNTNNPLGMYKITSFNLTHNGKIKLLDIQSQYIELITNNNEIVSFTIKTPEYF